MDGFFKMYDRDANGDYDAGYKTQRKVVDFFVFFAIFLSVAWLGLTKAFGDQGKGNASKALAVAIGFALALSLVAFSNVSLAYLFPFARNLLFLLAFLLIYFLLLKMGLDKKKFLAVILALVITIVLFMLYNLGSTGKIGFPGFDGIGGLKGIFSRPTLEDVENQISATQQKIAELDPNDPKYQEKRQKLEEQLIKLEKKKVDIAEAERREAIKEKLAQDKAGWKAVYDEGDPQKMAALMTQLMAEEKTFAPDDKTDRAKAMRDYIKRLNSSITIKLGPKVNDLNNQAAKLVEEGRYYAARDKYEEIAENYSAAQYPGTSYEADAKAKMEELDTKIADIDGKDENKVNMLKQAEVYEKTAKAFKKSAYFKAPSNPLSAKSDYLQSKEDYQKAIYIYEELVRYSEFQKKRSFIFDFMKTDKRYDAEAIEKKLAAASEDLAFVESQIKLIEQNPQVGFTPDRGKSEVGWAEKPIKNTTHFGKKNLWWLLPLAFFVIFTRRGRLGPKYAWKFAKWTATGGPFRRRERRTGDFYKDLIQDLAEVARKANPNDLKALNPGGAHKSLGKIIERVKARFNQSGEERKGGKEAKPSGVKPKSPTTESTTTPPPGPTPPNPPASPGAPATPTAEMTATPAAGTPPTEPDDEDDDDKNEGGS
ncbi:MAG: hypothetical protein V1735_02315 [Nanoarchaeota archaeon]